MTHAVLYATPVGNRHLLHAAPSEGHCDGRRGQVMKLRRCIASLATVGMLAMLLVQAEPRQVTGSGYSAETGKRQRPAPKESGSADKAIRKRWLVQFNGPVRPEQRRQLEALGCRIGDYMPTNAFVALMDDKAAKRVALLSFVEDITRFAPADKLVGTARKDLTAAPTSEIRIRKVLRVDDPADRAAVIAATLRGNGRILNVGARTITVEVPEELLAPLAQQEETAWIGEVGELRLHNSDAAWVVQTNEVDNRTIWEKGITGAGQIVGIADSGVDYDMPWFADPNGALPGPGHRKIVGYDATLGDNHDVADGHGTHIAGTICGDRGPGMPGNGIAPGARIHVQDLVGTDGTLTGSLELETVLKKAYDSGARIFNGSWGVDSGNYDALAAALDDFSWRHKDFLAVFANGNGGPAEQTATSPAIAKNATSVVATGNGTDAATVSAESSVGQAPDGRANPSVGAPGQGVVSARSDGLLGSGNSGTMAMSGTSVAAAVTSGAAALIRQYFTDGFFPTGSPVATNKLQPSAALLKAVLVNSAEALLSDDPGDSCPSKRGGWGRPKLINTLFFNGDSHSLEVVDGGTGLETDGVWQRLYFSPGGRRLKITLAWTDAPAAPGATSPLTNDLNLVVVAPDGTTYLGNDLNCSHGDYESRTGGFSDRVNVEEQVVIKRPVAGTYLVKVIGASIPVGPQPFALVMTGVTGVTSDGRIALTNSTNGTLEAPGQVSVMVTDRDINRDASAIETMTVDLLGETESNPEQVVLTETGPNTGTFTGTCRIALGGTAIHDNGALEARHGETISARYTDEINLSGYPRLVSVSARIVDSVPPTISAVGVGAQLSETSATVAWTTDEPADSKVSYGSDGSLGLSVIDGAFVSNHLLALSGLSEGQDYFFSVTSSDAAGNVSTDTNGGNNYTFRTASLPPSLEVFCSAENNETYLPTVRVFGTATDPAGIDRVTVNGQPAVWRATDGYYEATASLVPGSNTITVIATDTLNNPAGQTLTVNRTLPPFDLLVTSVVSTTNLLPSSAIRVDGTVRNEGTADAPSAEVAFYLSRGGAAAGIPLGSIPISPIPAGQSGAVSFTASLPPEVVPGVYFIVATVDPADQVAEAREDNNSLTGNPVTVGRPDLVPLTVSNTTLMSPGGTISTSLSVRNDGAASAPVSTVAAWLSVDTNLSGDDILIGTAPAAALSPGASTTVGISGVLPPGIQSGTLNIIAVVDALGEVAEADENNNRATGQPLTIGTAELSVTTVTMPASIVRGSTASATATVANTGHYAATGVRVGVYLSSDTAITTSDMFLGSGVIASLEPGASAPVSIPVPITDIVAAGTWYVGAVVDDLGMIAESDEGNNALAGNQVEILADGLDLTVQGVTAPASGTTGQPVTITATVAATMPAAASAVQFFVSRDPVITSADTYLATKAVGSFGAAGAQTVTATVTLPTTLTSDTWYLGAIADAYGVITEINETNNASAGRAITVNGPELVVESLTSASDTAYTAGTVSLASTIRSMAGAAPTHRVEFYLSTDPAITTSDIYLGYRTASLPAGGSSTATTILTIPRYLTGGDYYIGAIADPGNVIAEANENDNSLGIPLHIIGPDLQVDGLSLPGSALSGVPLTISSRAFSTQGGSGSFTVDFYLSSDQTITTGDVYLGRRTVSSLAVAGASTATATVTIPNYVFTGRYYVGAIVDPYNYVKEETETNNSTGTDQAVVVEVTGAELALASLSAPASAKPGETIAVVNALATTAGSAPSSYMEFYLSTDSIITAADRYLGGRTVSALPAGGANNAATGLKVPADILPGTYYLGAVSDPYNTVREANEADNTRTVQLTVTGRDLTVEALSGPAAALAGATIGVANAVKSAGGAVPGFDVTFYLSRDAVITRSDAYLGTRFVSGLDIDGANTVTTTLKLPNDLEGGRYYLGAIVDGGNLIPETDESNNASAAAPIDLVGADLAVSALTAPATASAGETISAQVIVTTRAGGSPYSLVNYYLSTDETVSPDDIYLGVSTIPSLGPGGGATVGKSVKLPADMEPATYYLIAVADPANAVAEADETNNTSQPRAIAVTVP